MAIFTKLKTGSSSWQTCLTSSNSLDRDWSAQQEVESDLTSTNSGTVDSVASTPDQARSTDELDYVSCMSRLCIGNSASIQRKLVGIAHAHMGRGTQDCMAAYSYQNNFFSPGQALLTLDLSGKNGHHVGTFAYKYNSYRKSGQVGEANASPTLPGLGFELDEYGDFPSLAASIEALKNGTQPRGSETVAVGCLSHRVECTVQSSFDASRYKAPHLLSVHKNSRVLIIATCRDWIYVKFKTQRGWVPRYTLLEEQLHQKDSQ